MNDNGVRRPTPAAGDPSGRTAKKTWLITGESLAAEVARFGIHVTLVEPGGYETDWAGSSSRRGEPLPAWEDLAVRAYGR